MPYINVGNENLKNMIRAVSFHGVHPIIDRVSPFEEARRGVRALRRRAAFRQGRHRPLRPLRRIVPFHHICVNHALAIRTSRVRSDDNRPILW